MKHYIADDEILEQAALYALGALTPPEAQKFESHLAEHCETCQTESEALAAVVAQLGLAAPEAAAPVEAREELLARIAAEPRHKTKQTTSSEVLPAFLTIRACEGEWQEVAPGAFFKQLFVNNVRQTITWLVKMEPGSHLPKHRHLGVEESIILTGDCWANGEEFGPGDYRCALPGSVDESVYTVGGTTLLLVAPMNVELL